MKKSHTPDWAISLWEESWTYIKTVIDTVQEPFLILDEQFRVIVANASFYRLFHTTKKETENKFIYELNGGKWNIPDLHILLEEVLPKTSFFRGYEVHQRFPEIGYKDILINGRRIYKSDGLSTMSQPTILLAIEDITGHASPYQKTESSQENTSKSI